MKDREHGIDGLWHTAQEAPYGDKCKGNPSSGDLCMDYQISPRCTRNMVRTIRYTRVSKKRFKCEMWDSYNPNFPGVHGRQTSRLRATYTVLRTWLPASSEYQFNIIGEAITYHWSGKVSRKAMFVSVARARWNSGDSSILRDVTFDSKGRLTIFEDRTRGANDPRGVSFTYKKVAGGLPEVRNLNSLRTKYKDIDFSETNQWDNPGSSRVRVTEDGSPLYQDSDCLERDIRADGSCAREVRRVRGRKHGLERMMTVHGRVEEEKFYHHDTEIPRWAFEKPETITLEEMLGEKNAEVRRAFLELQGFEVFLSRAQHAGMCTIVDEDPDDRVGTLIRIELEGEVETFGSARNKDVIDTKVHMLLKVKDGTLPKSYVLRVPSEMKTAREANAWTWGLQSNEYMPLIER